MSNSLGVLFPSSQAKAEDKVGSFLLSMQKNQEIPVSEVAGHLGFTPSITKRLLEWIIRHQEMPRIVVVSGIVKKL